MDTRGDSCRCGSLWYDFGWTGWDRCDRDGAAARGRAEVGRVARPRGLALGRHRNPRRRIHVAVLVAVDSLAFPFMMVGFVLLDIVQRCSAGRRNWLLLGCRVVFRTRDRP